MADPMQEGRRSKSQVSIYDYPEHLNPFYEDENHKRLRFWKIGKSKDGSSSRRGSFSLGGLREMWAFKSFRGKKKSSTLGINKTSESPEPLRKTLGPNDNPYATYDPRYRNTYDNGSVNNNFQRNVPYRTSLQDMSYNKGINGNGIGFARNDNYRSTIQIGGRRIFNDSLSSTPTAPPRRYVYGGSITPQPRTRFDHNTSLQGISLGSSQLSVASSTNPFEDEDDDDVVMGRLSSTESGDHPTPTKRIRKKRRAPPPPVPIPKSIDEEVTVSYVSPNNATSHQTTITETIRTASPTATPPSTPTDDGHNIAFRGDAFENQLQRQMKMPKTLNDQEQLEISEIAAEIEHYVKLLSQDDEDVSAVRLIPVSTPAVPVLKKAKSSTTIARTPSPAQIKKSGSETIGQSAEAGIDIDDETKSKVATWSEGIANKKNRESFRKFMEIRRNSLKPTPATRQRPSIVSITSSDPGDTKQSISPERELTPPSERPVPALRQISPVKDVEIQSDASVSPQKITEMSIDISSGDAACQITPYATTEQNNEDQRSETSKEHTPLNSSYDAKAEESSTMELKITESREDISDISNTSSERYQIRYVPLKEGSPDSPPEMRKDPNSEFKPVNHNVATIHSTYNEGWVDDQEPRRRPSVERRRSVKEIIESINRSQSLLKVNQDPQKSTKITSYSVNDLNGSLPKNEQQIETPNTTPPSKDSPEVEEAYRRLSQSEAEIKRMILEMENLTQSSEMNNYCDNVPSILARFDEEVNNNDIFKKCVLKKQQQLFREGSPTASNLDWNPVPKPKRSKNLSVELNNNKSNGN